MFTVGKDVGLQWQKSAARIDQVDTGQVILFGDLLGAKMFLYGHWIVGATLDGRVIGDNHAFLAFHQPDACDDTRRRRLVMVHIPCRQWAEFQEGRIWITEQLDAFTCQQFIAFAMFSDGIFASTLLYQLNTLAELIYYLLEVVCILLKFGTIAVYTCFDNAHKTIFLSTTLSVGSAMLLYTIGRIAPRVEERQVRTDLQEYRLPAWC